MESQRVGHDNDFHFTSFPWYKPEFFSLKQRFHHPTPQSLPCLYSFGFSSTGSDEAVVDTSRRVGGALARKSALRDRLNDAMKRLQAAERGEGPNQNVSSSVCSLILRETSEERVSDSLLINLFINSIAF